MEDQIMLAEKLLKAQKTLAFISGNTDAPPLEVVAALGQKQDDEPVDFILDSNADSDDRRKRVKRKTSKGLRRRASDDVIDAASESSKPTRSDMQDLDAIVAPPSSLGD